MKLGVLCGENLNPSQIVQNFYDHGISTVELVYNSRFTLKELKNIKSLGADISIHCPFKDLRVSYSLARFMLGNIDFGFRKHVVRSVENGLLAAERLEATHYVMHGGCFPKGYFKFRRFIDEKKVIEAFVKLFKPLFVKAKDSGVKVVLENLTGGQIFSRINDIEYVKRKFPHAGFCLDFAHSELTKQTDMLKGLIIDHVHVSDNDLRNDLHLPVGFGKLNFLKLLDILKIQNFKGKIITECGSVRDAIKSFNEFRIKIPGRI